MVFTNMSASFHQVPFYRGERITFDVAPSRMNFKVEHSSLTLEVETSNCILFTFSKYHHPKSMVEGCSGA